MNDLFEKEQRVLDNAVEYLKGIEKGAACEYGVFEALVKEYDALLHTVQMIVKISDKTTIDLNESKLSLLDKVHYDTLTGIHNRRYLEETFMRVIKSQARSGGMLSVLMIDIDYFKKYNDTYGHSAGDKCLKAVARALKKSIMRPDDFVARYGGEEFVVILPNCDEKGARLIAEKLLHNVMKLKIPHENSEAANCVTVSIGVTSGRAYHNHRGVDYIDQADKALYMSKGNGRNRYTFIDLEEDLK